MDTDKPDSSGNKDMYRNKHNNDNSNIKSDSDNIIHVRMVIVVLIAYGKTTSMIRSKQGGRKMFQLRLALSHTAPNIK